MGERDYNLQINSFILPDANLVYFNATYSPSSSEIKSKYHRAIKASSARNSIYLPRLTL